MPSGKQAKRRRAQARTPPPPVRAAPRARKASPKVLAAAGVAVLVVAGAAIGLAVGLGGGSSKTNVPTRGSLTNALPGAAEIERLFKGVPQNDNLLGRPAAPVTLAEYVDLQCPFCQQFEAEVVPDLVARYVRTGKLRLEARPIAFIGPDSGRGRAAAIAAGEQDRMFNFMALLYANQRAENSGWLDDDIVAAAAASIPGLDVTRLLAGRDSSSVRSSEDRFDAQAESDHVTSTPTLFVGRTGGRLSRVRLASATDEQTLVQAIEKALG